MRNSRQDEGSSAHLWLSSQSDTCAVLAVVWCLARWSGSVLRWEVWGGTSEREPKLRSVPGKGLCVWRQGSSQHTWRRLVLKKRIKTVSERVHLQCTPRLVIR